MVRLFPLIMGLLLCVFCAAPSFSQDSLVTITPSTARYYLEVEDEMFALREKDSISNELIYSQAVTLDLKDQIIRTYQEDSVSYQKRDSAYSTHITLIRSELTKADKEIRKQKRIKWGVIILSVAGLLLL